MTQKFLIINRKEINDSEPFFLIFHSACRQLGKFQWFLKDNPTNNEEEYLENQVYESIVLSSKWIKDNAENKWIGCHCLLEDREHTKILGILSSDILTIIRNNTFTSIDVCDDIGNITNTYIRETDDDQLIPCRKEPNNADKM